LSESLFQSAVYWLRLGCAVLPCQPKSKRLLRGFGPYRRHIRHRPEAVQWFAARSCNLAVVCGVGCLVVADFDDVAAFDAWRAGPGAGLRTRIETTGRGAHVYFRTLAHMPALAVGPGLEVKASGAVLVAPSVHPLGMTYQVQADDAPIWIERPSDLFPLLSKANSGPARPLEKQAAQPKPERAKQATPGASRIEQIKAAVPVRAVAERLTVLKPSSDDGRWLLGHCPIHDDKRPSFWVDTERELWGCYSPHCPANRGGQKAHDVINLVQLAHRVPLAEAVQLLAEVAGVGR